MTAQFTTLFSFNGSNGSLLYAGLIADANRDLFGTTVNGGANSDGTVFEIDGGGTSPPTIFRDRFPARRRRPRRRSSRSRMRRSATATPAQKQRTIDALPKPDNLFAIDTWP